MNNPPKIQTREDIERELTAAVARGDLGPAPSRGALDSQIGGAHYKDQKIQHAEFCQANNFGWCESAAMKYLTRHKRKNGIEDLKKAIHYIQLCAQLEYGVDLTSM